MGADLPSARLLFQEAKDLLAHGVAVGARIDDKAANLVTFNSVVLGLLATAFTLSPWQVPPWLLALSWSGPAFLLGSVFCALRAYHPTEYALALSARSVDEAASYDTKERDFLAAATHAYRAGTARNAKRVREKVAWLRRSLRLLVAGLTAATGSVAFIMALRPSGAP
jgi:hypothetical protein